MLVRLIVLTSFAFLVPLAAQAHRLNESYVYFNVAEDSFSGRFEATVSDLDLVLSIDDDGDGQVSEDELAAHAPRVFTFFADRLTVAHEGETFPITYERMSTLKTAQGVFAQVWFDVPGITATPDVMDITYQPMADVLGAGHLGFILIESNSRLQLEGNESYISLIFEPGDGPKQLSLVGEPLGKLFFDFVEYGIWHIWMGFDHLVFLITLLLPAAMLQVAGRWAPLESFRPAFWNVVKIVTVFTVSHSITLSMAALGVIQLPVVFVESVIAVSIAVVALMNFFPNTHRYVLWVVFVFGLFHGLGFANVLAPLGLAPTQLLVGMVAFNIGVELGQVVIVMIAFPIIWGLRNWRFYRPLALNLGSLAMIALAGTWLLERTTEFEWNVRATLSFLQGLIT